MTYEKWWWEFIAEHEDWRLADSDALRRAAFEFGKASRDAEVAELNEQVTLLRDAPDYVIRDLKLRADLNEDDPGVIELGDGALQQAEEALAATADLKGVILCHAEPVAYLDANYGFMRCGNVADSLSIGTQLYAPKRGPKNSSV